MNDPAATRVMLSVPELGPSLGRLCASPAAEVAAGASPLPLLDDIRFDLVAVLFGLASAARGFAATADRGGAVASLSRSAWLQAWEDAVAQVGRRVTEWANTRLAAAAAESRLPVRKLKEIEVSEEETRGITARLGAGGGGFIRALDALERTAPHAVASGPRGDAGFAEWREQLLAAARQLEAAWLALERAARDEGARWDVEVERARAWRRPRWPLWLITVVLFALATYLGLLLGGYLAVPDMLRAFVNFWWYRA